MTNHVIRLERDGPAGTGLTQMELDSADFQSPLPEQHLHLAYEDPRIGLTVGTWTTTDMQEAFGPYPGDEFMVVLEGRLDMLDGSGHATPVETGQSFVLRNAIPVSWKQMGFLRKFFITLKDPDAETPVIESADGGVIVLNEEELAKAFVPDAESIGGGTQHDSPVFTNDAGTMTVGLWDSTPFESEMGPFSVNEFCQILEGRVTISHPDGTAQTFAKGDALFVPKGTICSWKADGYVRKTYVIVDV